MANLSLPTDSKARKSYPLFDGLFGYFGAALAGVAHHSWRSNEKHNPGQPLHWSVDNSTDHAECVLRHLLDLGDMLAALNRARESGMLLGEPSLDDVLAEADALAWRALALSQTLRMNAGLAPLPFNARRSKPSATIEKKRRSSYNTGYVYWVVDREGNVVRPEQVPVVGWPALRCERCQVQPCICGPT